MKKIIYLTLAGVLLIAGGVVGTLFITGVFPGKATADAATDSKDAPAKPKTPAGPPIYVSLDPGFTVTFSGGGKAQFMQVKMDVATYDPEVQEVIETNMPAVRNGLVMLLSSQKPENLESREGIEVLREEALKEIQGIVKSYTGKPGVTKVFFTSFMIQ